MVRRVRKMLRFETKTIAQVVSLACLPMSRPIQEVPTVELHACDLTGSICTRWNERESTWRKTGHAPTEVQARANRDDAAAD